MGVIHFQNKRELNLYVKEKGLKEGDYHIWTSHQTEPIEFAISNLRNSISSVHKRIRGREQVFFLSGRDCFRERIAVTRPYKGNRDPDHKPVHYAEMRDYATRRLGAEITSGIEADDACAIEAMKDRKNSVIVSNDKDLKQIPTWHYDWTQKDGRPIYIGTRDATLSFYAQVLSGDPTDNVEGIPGVGPARARRILDNVKDIIDCERRCVDAYRQHFGDSREGETKFLETARLVRILRYPEDKERLWTPRVELSVEAD